MFELSATVARRYPPKVSLIYMRKPVTNSLKWLYGFELLENATYGVVTDGVSSLKAVLLA